MAKEVEKKYRLPEARREQVLEKLKAVGATFEGADEEENTLYRGGILSLKGCILRLRETQDKFVLTYKEPAENESASAAKSRTEHETEIKNGEEMRTILAKLEYRPALVYEKRRQIFQLEKVEVVVDELPFGWYLEIEGAEADISAAEKTLEIENLEAEPQPYPSLTAQFGEKRGGVVEARFPEKKD